MKDLKHWAITIGVILVVVAIANRSSMLLTLTNTAPLSKPPLP